MQEEESTTDKELLLSLKKEGHDFLSSEKEKLGQIKNHQTLPDFLADVIFYVEKTKNFEGSIELLNDLYQAQAGQLDIKIKNELLIHLAWHCNQSYQHQKSLSYLQEISRAYLDIKEMAKVAYYTGQAYYGIGSFDLALEAYLKALSYFEKTASHEYLGSLYNDLGLLYNTLDDTNNAIKYLTKAIEKAEMLGIEHQLAQYLSNLGTIYNSMGANQLALEVYSKSLDIAEQLGDSVRMAQILMNKGNVYKNYEKYGEANRNYGLSILICKLINVPYGIYLNYINISENARKWGKLDLALAAMDSAENLSKTFDGQKEKITLFTNKSELLSDLRRYKEAMEALKYAHELEKEIQNEEVQSKIKELTVTYENEVNLVKIKNMNLELEKVRLTNSIYSSIFISLLIITILAFFIRNIKKEKLSIIYKLNLEILDLYDDNESEQDKELPSETISNKNKELLKTIYEKLNQYLIHEEGFRNPDLNLNFLANLTECNVKYVSMAIKQETGKSFNKFLNGLRITEAKKMILQIDDYNKVQLFDIMEEVGYTNRSTFNIAFQKETGMSPSEFKNQAVLKRSDLN